MKKYAAFILTFVITLSTVFITSAGIPGFTTVKKTTRVVINGNEVKLTLPILNKAGRNYYPFREMCEGTGATVSWESGKLSAEINGKAVSFFVGKSGYYANGKYMYMPDAKVEADTSNDRTYVPIRYAMEALGFDVVFFSTQKYDIIRIANPKPTEERDVIMQLQGYKDNIGVPKYWVEDYLPNEKFISYGQTPALTYNIELAETLAATAENLLLTDFNVSYKDLNGFFEKYRYFFMPEATNEIWLNGQKLTNEQYIQNRINDIKKYKIICKSDVISDWSLVYRAYDDEMKSRCRLKIFYESVDANYFKKYNMKVLKPGKWYYVDIEVSLAWFFSRNPDKWQHPQFTYSSYTYISDFKEIVK